MPTYQFREGPLPIKNAKMANVQKLGETWCAAVELAEKARSDAPTDVASKETTAAKIIHADAVRIGATHPFHGQLLWDDKIAGLHWRLAQIRKIAGMIRVVNEKTSEEERPVVHVLGSSTHAAGFRRASTIVSSLDLQIATLRGAERDLQAFRNRYRDLADLCEGAAALQERARKARENLMMSAAGQQTEAVA